LQLDLVSDEQTAAMGAEAKPQLVAEYGGEVDSKELRAYVKKVGERLAKHVEPEYQHIQWDFTVLDSDVVNAFALPGGYVFMSRGLLAMMSNEAQLAGVLGHEIGHVTAKHVDERLSQAMLTQLGLDILGAASDTQLINAGAQILAQGTLLKFGRDQESEADSQGLKYMTAEGYDPAAMLEVMRILDEASKGSSPPELLSSHPLPETRIKRIQAQLDEQYGYTQGDSRYQKYEKRFEQEARPYLGNPSAALAAPALAGSESCCPLCSALSRAQTMSPSPRAF
jgi:predicted Zn-dependent protease